MEVISRNILARIKKMGVKRKDVAEKIGMDPAYFYRMLSGMRPWRLDYLEKVARVLKVPTWRLLYECEEEPTERASPDLLLGPADRELLAVVSDEYVKLPVIRLSVAIATPDETLPPGPAWLVLAKKSLVDGISLAREPLAMELVLKVK